MLDGEFASYYEEKDRSRSAKKLFKRSIVFAKEFQRLFKEYAKEADNRLCENVKAEEADIVLNAMDKCNQMIKIRQAFTLLAAEKGHPQALCDIAFSFINLQKKCRPLYCFQKARQEVENGNLGALGTVGKFYLSTMVNGCREEERALKIFELGAAEGDPECTYYLGLAYLQGFLKVQKNPERGVALLKKAVENGLNNSGIRHCAKSMLGKCHSQSIGVEKNNQLAKEYYRQAVDENEIFHEECRIKLKNLKRKNNSEDKVPGKKMRLNDLVSWYPEF